LSDRPGNPIASADFAPPPEEDAEILTTRPAERNASFLTGLPFEDAPDIRGRAINSL